VLELLNNPVLAENGDQWPRLIFFIVLAVFWAIGKLFKAGQEKAKTPPAPSQRGPARQNEELREIPSAPQRQQQAGMATAGSSPRDEYDREVALARERFDEVLEKIRDYKDKFDQMAVDEDHRKQVLYKIEQAKAQAYREFEIARGAAKQKMEAAIAAGGQGAVRTETPVRQPSGMGRAETEYETTEKQGRQEKIQRDTVYREKIARQVKGKRDREIAEKQAARADLQRQAELKRKSRYGGEIMPGRREMGGSSMVRRSPSEALKASDAAHGMAAAMKIKERAHVGARLGKIDLATAIIYSEILGKPVAMRE